MSERAIVKEKVELAVSDGTRMAAYVARPESGGPHPGLLVFQEAFGVNHHIRNVCDRFGAEGYVAIAPELFHRTAPGFEGNYADFDSVRPHVQAVTAENAELDVRAAYEWLRSNDIDVVGPTDHKGLIYSIYFHDPNGMRLEITTPLDSQWKRHTAQGTADLKMWCDVKKKAIAENRDVSAALVALIRDQRKRYEYPASSI